MTSCSVIMPVGPGHEALAPQAQLSVMQAAQEHMGRFDTIHLMIGDDTEGDKERSKTRNQLVSGPEQPWIIIQSAFEGDKPKVGPFETEWLFFLDADDMMCSGFTYGNSAFATLDKYMDDYDLLFGSIHELDPNTGVIRKREQVEPITSLYQYLNTPPFKSCQMGHFCRRSCFEPFDESMNAGEDIKYYINAWEKYRCLKTSEALFLNRRGMHSWMYTKGKPNGRDWSEKAHELIEEARGRHKSFLSF